MLEIRQKNDIAGYAGYIWDYQLTADEIQIVEAFEKEKVIGFCIYSYTEDSVEIYHAKYGDNISLFDGIIRTVLFKAFLKGINKARYHFEDMLLYKLKLADDYSNTLSSIENVMNNCGNCKNSS
mgnify:FL=1